MTSTASEGVDAAVTALVRSAATELLDRMRNELDLVNRRTLLLLSLHSAGKDTTNELPRYTSDSTLAESTVCNVMSMTKEQGEVFTTNFLDLKKQMIDDHTNFIMAKSLSEGKSMPDLLMDMLAKAAAVRAIRDAQDAQEEIKTFKGFNKA